MTEATAWPSLIVPREIEWTLDNPAKSGGISVDGVERTVIAMSMRWRVKLTFTAWGTVADPRRILTWRALEARLSGRVGHILVPSFDWLTPERIVGTPSAPITFDDGSTFGDGSTWGDLPAGTVSAAAARGASALSVSYIGAGEVRAGMYFGLCGERMYRIYSCVANDAGGYDLTFRPPLRAAAGAGDLVDFEAPICRMKLATDTAASLPVKAPWVGDASVELVEVM